MHFLAQAITNPSTLASFITGSSKAINTRCLSSKDTSLQAFGNGVATFGEWASIGTLVGAAGMAVYFAIRKGSHEQPKSKPEA